MLAKKIFWAKKCWTTKMLAQNMCLPTKNLWVIKKIGQKKLWRKTFGQKNVGQNNSIQTFFLSKQKIT